MITTMRNRLLRFARKTDGNVSMEAMILFPALAMIFAASWVYFDVMRQQSISQKANYTIGDIISRETEKLDDAYIDNARRMLFHLTKAHGDDVDLRVTVIQFDERSDSHRIVWGENRGDWDALNTTDLVEMRPLIPQMADSDQLILVETRDAYVPTFNVSGIGPFDIETYSFTRPRFASQVIFEGVNDGTGADGTTGAEDEPEEDGTPT
ncbi:hypothetical protein [Marivita sp. GX14005]|uniref:TadE/TadG family type IV pilus assembly protein n=1 Tax=Marivita sp. GX14005 TaxID=2942276 RepID=UPI0020196CB7|nr:hypothetical protein [Marivita sp. GX14005]MCL3881175.1 hypothetical protein [Marivita sp. GX14005]